jgi:hypothetical protein
LLAAAMSEYSLIEPANMQIPRGRVNYSSTLRINYTDTNGRIYSNVHDKKSVIENIANKGGTETLKVFTELVGIGSATPPEGRIPLEIVYSFEGDTVTIQVSAQDRNDLGKLRLMIPVISCADEELIPITTGFRIEKEKANVLICSKDAPLLVFPVEANGRAFNAVPGFEFVPLCAEFSGNVSLQIICRDNRKKSAEF